MLKRYTLEYFQYSGGTNVTPTATVGLRDNGSLAQEAACGDGPVDAAYKAIDSITGLRVELADYSIRSAAKGRDAKGEVMVKISGDGRTITGRGASTDIIEASAKAYVNAINEMIARR